MLLIDSELTRFIRLSRWRKFEKIRRELVNWESCWMQQQLYLTGAYTWLRNSITWMTTSLRSSSFSHSQQCAQTQFWKMKLSSFRMYPSDYTDDVMAWEIVSDKPGERKCRCRLRLGPVGKLVLWSTVPNGERLSCDLQKIRISIGHFLHTSDMVNDGRDMVNGETTTMVLLLRPLWCHYITNVMPPHHRSDSPTPPM